jgi:hypothetical protein
MSRQLKVDVVSFHWMFLISPLALEYDDIRRRNSPFIGSGCLLLNLHGAIKTPSQHSFYARSRAAYSEMFPEHSDTELDAMAYNQGNIVFTRMFWGEIVGALIANLLVGKLINII